MSHFGAFRKYIHEAGVREADRQLSKKRKKKPSNALAAQIAAADQRVLRSLQELDDASALTFLTRFNTKSVHDALVAFLVDQHELPAWVDDCATHDVKAQTAFGGRMRFEVKYVTVDEDGRGTVTNKNGAPAGMNLVLLVNDVTRPEPELMVIQAHELRRIATTPPSLSGGWSISVNQEKLEYWRESGFLRSFDKGMAQFRSLLTGRRLRRR